eukprot:COSAG03_NODE_690_length_6284_cov_7.961358_4_plen_121_part_00
MHARADLQPHNTTPLVSNMDAQHFLGGRVPAMSATLEDLKTAIDHFKPKFNDGSLVPSDVVIWMLRDNYGDGPVTVGQLECMGDWIPLADCADERLFIKILACAHASTQHDYDEIIANGL